MGSFGFRFRPGLVRLRRMLSRLLQRWEISASTGSHFDVLDGLRGVAILLVVAFHALYTNPSSGLASKLTGYIFTAGWMGVPVFFVLSGFLISYPFFKGRRDDSGFWYQRGYALRRIGKIIPPFYLSLLFSILPCFWLRDWTNLDYAWKWATGVANFIETPTTFSPFYWSLIIESQFYILLPLLFWLLRGLDVARTATGLFLILFFVPLLARQWNWPSGMLVWPDENTLSTCEWLFRRFPCQLDYFAFGVLFAGIYVALGETVREQLRGLSLLGYVGAALMIVTLLLWGHWAAVFGVRAHPTRWSVEAGHLLPAVASMLMLFFVFDRGNWGSRFFSQGWLRFIGIVSYEWFLFHGPFVAWFHTHIEMGHGNILVYLCRNIAPLVLSFIFSVLVYRCFSLPILNRIRDRVKASRA
jgi:peptidoglycan/LPS O-acetylase OafA/YrhL